VKVRYLAWFSIAVFILGAFLDYSITYRKAHYVWMEGNPWTRHFWVMLGKDIALLGGLALEIIAALGLYAFRKNDYAFCILFSMVLLFLAYLHFLGWQSWL